MTESQSKFIPIVSGSSVKDDKAFVTHTRIIVIGETIIWKNTDIITHIVTTYLSNNGYQNSSAFDSRLLDPGKFWPSSKNRLC